jgi:hypothetical protein
VHLCSILVCLQRKCVLQKKEKTKTNTPKRTCSLVHTFTHTCTLIQHVYIHKFKTTCILTHIHTNTHVQSCTQIHTHIIHIFTLHAPIPSLLHICTHLLIHTCTHTCSHTYTLTHTIMPEQLTGNHTYTCLCLLG